MQRIKFRTAAGFLTVAIGCSSIGLAAAADTKDKAGRVLPNSPAAKAPLLGRVLITPTPEQMAMLRQERRMSGFKQSAATGLQAGGKHSAAVGAL